MPSATRVTLAAAATFATGKVHRHASFFTAFEIALALFSKPSTHSSIDLLRGRNREREREREGRRRRYAAIDEQGSRRVGPCRYTVSISTICRSCIKFWGPLIELKILPPWSRKISSKSPPFGGHIRLGVLLGFTPVTRSASLGRQFLHALALEDTQVATVSKWTRM